MTAVIALNRLLITPRIGAHHQLLPCHNVWSSLITPSSLSSRFEYTTYSIYFLYFLSIFSLLFVLCHLLLASCIFFSFLRSSYPTFCTASTCSLSEVMRPATFFRTELDTPSEFIGTYSVVFICSLRSPLLSYCLFLAGPYFFWRAFPRRVLIWVAARVFDAYETLLGCSL